MGASKAEAETHWARWDATQWDDRSFPDLARLAPHFLITKADDDLRFMLGAFLDAIEMRR
jgi:hypothetical protein